MDAVEKLADSVLYEGYRLFPYNPSSMKNTKPSLFGAVYPEAYNMQDKNANSYIQTECIIRGSASSMLSTDLRFLQFKEMKFFLSNSEGKKEHVKNLGKPVFSMHGYFERRIQTGNVRISELTKERQFAIEFAEEETKSEMFSNAGDKQLTSCLSKLSSLKGSLSILAVRIEEEKDLFRIRVRITNVTPLDNNIELNRDLALRQSFLYTHLILKIEEGKFLSLTDTDNDTEEIVKECRNVNMWPVLARRENDVMLSSPIILYDYPEIAPESTGDFFDSTEIEEYLLLHIALLSDDEREKFSQGDDRMRVLFENVKEIGPDQMLKLHGTLRFSKSNQHENSKANQGKDQE